MAKQGPPKEKPKAITVHLVKFTRRHIFVGYDKGDEVLTCKSRDNPLPSFVAALMRLDAVVQKVLHLPASYPLLDVKVTGAKLGLECGVKTVSIMASQSLEDAAKPFKIVTPPRLLETPKEPGTYTPPLAPALVEAVSELEQEAKRYVLGERAQGQLALGEDDADDDTDDQPEAKGAELPGMSIAPDSGSMGRPAKKRTK